MTPVKTLRAAITALQETVEIPDRLPFVNWHGNRRPVDDSGKHLACAGCNVYTFDPRPSEFKPVFDTGDVPRDLLIALFELAISVEGAALDVPPWQSVMGAGIPAAVLALAAGIVKGEKK